MEHQLTYLQFFLVLVLMLGGWWGMGTTMRGGLPSWRRGLVILVFFAVMMAGIALGMYWKSSQLLQ